MQNHHSYNLRPRKSSHEQSIPKPEIGDRVSIFWEALGKEYEGNLTKLDNLNKTFLVDYDNIPDGYDDHRIWENLDFVPWRFLDKWMQRKLRSLGKAAKSHSRLRDTKGMGNVPRWVEPGELSTAHPEFCEMSDRHLHRGKRKRKVEESCAEVTGGSEEEEEDMILESEGGEDESEHCKKEEDEEQTDTFGDYPFPEKLNNPKKSAERPGELEISKRRRKRTYANFGAFGFDRSLKELFCRATPPGECSTRFAQDTIRVNSSRDWAIKEASNVLRATNGAQQNCTLFQRPRNQIFQYSVPDGNANDSPTVEDQVRAIPKSLGIYGRHQV